MVLSPNVVALAMREAFYQLAGILVRPQANCSNSAAVAVNRSEGGIFLGLD
jgi:hypothetical protein